MAKSALSKIVKAAAAQRKRHPHKHKNWKGFVKAASAAYKSGRLGKAKKTRKSPRRKKAVARKAVARKVTVIRVVAGPKTRSRRKHHRSATRKRPRKVGSTGRSGGGKKDSTIKWLIIGGVVVGALYLLTRKAKPVVPQLPAGVALVNTPNQVRNQQANQILAYATAAGMLLPDIIKLVQSLNTQSDAAVSQQAANLGIPAPGSPGYDDWWAGN